MNGAIAEAYNLKNFNVLIIYKNIFLQTFRLQNNSFFICIFYIFKKQINNKKLLKKKQSFLFLL